MSSLTKWRSMGVAPKSDEVFAICFEDYPQMVRRDGQHWVSVLTEDFIQPICWAVIEFPDQGEIDDFHFLERVQSAYRFLADYEEDWKNFPMEKKVKMVRSELEEIDIPSDRSLDDEFLTGLIEFYF